MTKKYYKGTSQDVDGKPLGPPYLPDPGLVDAVNLAIMLERPLLLKGEPGCGKTRLAKAVADELGYDYHPWIIKSTSRAQDGLYTYDALRHLRESQRKVDKSTSDYVNDGPLGKAFNGNKPSVVLIDEIDKADLDFPNDLLYELEERRYYIPELQDWRPSKDKKGMAPLIIITSNSEKELPDAFLRRCLFYFIEFPAPEQLQEILQYHFPKSPKKAVSDAVEVFMDYRKQMEVDKGRTNKKISTSELLDWFRLQQHPDRTTIKTLSEGGIPYYPTLLKHMEDYVRYIVKGTQ